MADAHADSLMWNRDLTLRSDRGDVDFPRLREGGAKLQCFTLVTRGLPSSALARWNGGGTHRLSEGTDGAHALSGNAANLNRFHRAEVAEARIRMRQPGTPQAT